MNIRTLERVLWISTRCGEPAVPFPSPAAEHGKRSAEDVDAAIATYDLITEINTTPERAGKAIRIAMVLTMGMQSTVISRHVRSQLEGEGFPLLKAEMTNRVAYPESGIDGLSPIITDPEGAAARDIAAIALELAKLEISKSRNVERRVLA